VAALPTDVIDTVALLVTELVSNAVLHARTRLQLEVDVTPRVVRLCVRDGSRHRPILRRYDVGDVTGRGLALVEMLATEWGIDEMPNGKSVWCEIVIPGRTAEGR
jgi:anti-sigma regulatory factor (Ser/Thr protein kinase)